jgi:hypothetical protein
MRTRCVAAISISFWLFDSWHSLEALLAFFRVAVATTCAMGPFNTMTEVPSGGLCYLMVCVMVCAMALAVLCLVLYVVLCGLLCSSVCGMLLKCHVTCQPKVWVLVGLYMGCTTASRGVADRLDQPCCG